MKREELTKTFMMISNWKKPFALHGLYKNISALQGLRLSFNQREIYCNITVNNSNCLLQSLLITWKWQVSSYLPLPETIRWPHVGLLLGASSVVLSVMRYVCMAIILNATPTMISYLSFPVCFVRLHPGNWEGDFCGLHRRDYHDYGGYGGYDWIGDGSDQCQ